MQHPVQSGIRLWFKVKLKLKCLRLIRLIAIDVILRYAASKKHCIIGTTIFPRPTENHSNDYLGQGRDIWYGYTQTVRTVSAPWGGFAVNIDAKTSAFYRACKLLDFAWEVFEVKSYDELQNLLSPSRNENNVKKLENHLKGYIFKERFNLTNFRHSCNFLIQYH